MQRHNSQSGGSLGRGNSMRNLTRSKTQVGSFSSGSASTQNLDGSALFAHASSSPPGSPTAGKAKSTQQQRQRQQQQQAESEAKKKAAAAQQENSEAQKPQQEQQRGAAVGDTALQLEEDIATLVGDAFDPLPEDANVDDAIDELFPHKNIARLHLRGHADAVKCCTFDAHHRLLFTASWDGMVLAWNLEFFNAPVARMPHREWVNAVATTYVPDLTVLSATEDGYLFGWQCEMLLAEKQLDGTASNNNSNNNDHDLLSHHRKFEIVAQIQVAHGALTNLVVHQDFNFAFTSCGDTTYSVHLSSGSVVREYVTNSIVTALAAVDAVLCVAQQSGVVTVFDVVGSFILRELTGHRGSVRALSVVDPYTIMTTGDDCSVRVWNLASGACQSNRRRVHSRAITAITHFYTERDRMVVTAGMDGTVKVTRQSNGAIVAQYGLLCSCLCMVPPIPVDASNVEDVVDMLSTQQRVNPETGGGAGANSNRLWEEQPALEYTPSVVYHMKQVTENEEPMSPVVIPGTNRVINNNQITRSARWSFFQTLVCGGHTGRVTRLSLEAAAGKDHE